MIDPIATPLGPFREQRIHDQDLPWFQRVGHSILGGLFCAAVTNVEVVGVALMARQLESSPTPRKPACFPSFSSLDQYSRSMNYISRLGFQHQVSGVVQQLFVLKEKDEPILIYHVDH